MGEGESAKSEGKGYEGSCEARNVRRIDRIRVRVWRGRYHVSKAGEGEGARGKGRREQRELGKVGDWQVGGSI